MTLEMKSDKMSDIMDSIGESMDNEEEQEELYNQVLAEAGVKIEEDMVGPNKDKISAPQVNSEPRKQVVGAEGGGDDDLDSM